MSDYTMTRPCKYGCDGFAGTIERVGMQDVVRCATCGKANYNASRGETGEAVVSVNTTIHRGIKPKQRVRILMRAGTRCELCGSTEHLQVGHIVSVNAGLNYGIDTDLLNDDENLVALCAECNLGMGDEPIPLRIAVAILRARVAWSKANG